MEIICDKSLLSGAIDGVYPATTQHSSVPVLEGVLLKAEGFALTLTGYNLEMAITTVIEANVRVPGEIVLNARLLKDIAHRMPAGEVSIEVGSTGSAVIESGGAKYDIPAMAAGDFPTLPNPGADHTFSIRAGVLRDMIDRTLYAVGQDELKPAHTGELFEIAPEKLTVVALDGYRLAMTERPVKAEKEINIIIPMKTVTEVNKLIGDGEDEILVSANRRFIVFSARGYTIMSRLIEGEFMAWRGVIPQGHRTRAVLDTQRFRDSIERAALIITERLKNPLRITFGNGEVTVRCQTTQGKVVDVIEAEIEGDAVEIGFNHRYLLDALRNARADRVVFELNGPLSPVKVLPAEGEDFTYLVLPLRFKND